MKRARSSKAEKNFDAAMMRLVELYDFAPIPYVSFDRVGRVHEINFAAANLLSKTRNTLVGRPFSLCVADEDRAIFLRHLVQCRLREKPVETDLKLIGKDREQIPVRLASSPTGSFVSDGARLYQTVIYDLRERLAAEAALRQSERRFRRYFDLGLIGMAISTPERRYIEANEHLCQLLGYTREELLRKKWSDLAHPDDLEQSLAEFHRVMEGEIDGYTVDRRWIRKDGRVIDTVVSVNCVRLDNGSPDYFVTLIQDVTERKRAEEALRQSEEQSRAMLNQTTVGIARSGLKTRLVFVNHKLCQMLGYEETELLGRSFRDITHPKDRKKSRELFRGLAQKGEPFELEERYLRKDGSTLFATVSVAPIRDAAGKPCAAVAAILDISARKQAEEELLTTVAALRESEERFRLLIEGARDYAMFVLERDNHISYWSTGAERIFGWSAEEAIGRGVDVIFTEEDRTAEVEKKELAIARRKGTATNRRWHLRKNGSRIWVDGVMHRLNDPTGRLRGYAVIARDATDERKAQEQLQAAHDQLEQRVAQRTEQLLAAYTELRNEMEERQRLEREVLAVTERERARISQDLHDSLCQELAATAFLLKSRAKSFAQSVPSAAQSLEEAARTVNANAGLARDLARGLHPFEMESSGLIRALRELAGRTNSKTPCSFDSPREIQGLDDVLALNLYRIGQEAVLNALKHAKPSAIDIKLQPQNGEIVLSVKDDGRAIRDIDGKGPGLGIHLMRYRANVSGGTLQIDSNPGQGTTVICRVPLQSQ